VELFNEEVQIIGIDEFGYLKVKKQDNRLDILQPDGNRFDYMHNLIALRNSL
jgi:biotin--protein ligase